MTLATLALAPAALWLVYTIGHLKGFAKGYVACAKDEDALADELWEARQ